MDLALTIAAFLILVAIIVTAMVAVAHLERQSDSDAETQDDPRISAERWGHLHDRRRGAE